MDKSSLPLHDRLGRPLDSLRLSVTDRCNLRCLYCMPEEDYVWLPREELLSFEELARLVDVFTSLGVSPRPPYRRRTFAAPESRPAGRHAGAESARGDLALTTNGMLFADQAEALKRAGLGRVTISLDTLRPAPLPRT